MNQVGDKNGYRKLLNYLNKTTLNDTYHRIIVTLFENLYKIDTLKIEKLAELCYVSPSTMTRFLQTFGFKNYSSMKNEFQMMTQQSTQILFHMYKTEQYLLKENPQKYLENYSQQISKVICQSAKYIDIQAIDQLLEDIHQHKKIYLYGYSFGKNLALTMQDN
ncbi:MAG: MurR/RpiR family transcriptional regulator, partial [Longibaculum sp.]